MSKAKETLEKTCVNCKHEDKAENEFPCSCCIHNAIEKFEPKENVWIPIGKRPYEPCLLCFESGHMVVGYFHQECDEWRVLTADGFETGLIDEDLEDGEPIAYMPLPKPYKEGMNRE